MSEDGAEALLKKVRKLEPNRFCANCNTESPTGLGFGNVCIKFNTFVCDLCKTSHQAISHRCKSVSMSTWTLAEVHALTAAKGGGNDAARSTWLALAPPVGQTYPGGRRPQQGDKVDYFKQFVIDVYENRKFYSSDGGGQSRQQQESQHVPTPSSVNRQTSAPPNKVKEANFFDFDSQPPALTTSNSAPSTTIRKPQIKEANFLDFDSQPPALTTSTSTSSGSSGFSGFENFDSPQQKSNANNIFNFDGVNTTSVPPQSPSHVSKQNINFNAFSTFPTTPGGGSSGQQKQQGDVLDILSSNNNNASSSNTTTSNNVDIFGSSDQILIAQTSTSSYSGGVGVNTVYQQQQQQQQQSPMGMGMQQTRYGGGAAAISSIGSPGMMPLQMQQQKQLQGNQFDFVKSHMGQGGASSQQPRPQQNNSMFIQQQSNVPTSAMSNMNLGSNTGMMGGGSSAISGMNMMQQQPRRW